MTEQHLKTTLQDLHRHLESAGPVDAELKELLRTLDQDIHHLLAEEAPPADEASDIEEGSLSERAQQLSAKFAAQHPNLERVLRELGATLERMGI